MRFESSRSIAWLLVAIVGAPFVAGCSAKSDGPTNVEDAGGTAQSDAQPRSQAAVRPSEVIGGRRQATIATDRVVLRLAKVPAALKDKDVTDGAWSRWIQDVLGAEVLVVSVRLLRRTRGAPRAVDGSSLVVSVTRTSPERIRTTVARAAKRRDVRVEVDPVWTLHAVPNDPLFPQQWHLPKIRAPQAWDTTTGSADVTVAVLDTGIDANHVDLAGALWDNPGEIADGVDNDGNGLIDDVHGWNFASDNADLSDSTGHGTHVAGLVGARGNNGVGVAGVAFGAKVMPLKIANPGIFASSVAEAIFYAVDEGADVINMSFGGPETFAGVRDAVDHAVANGILLVGSAGNNSSEDYNFPAVLGDVIAVAATDENDARAGLSNYGDWVDIAAPGLNVFSTLPGNTYGLVSGTSQAAPIVAGVLALVKSAHPSWSAEQIRVQALAAADNLDALNPDYGGLLGAGRADAQEAVGPAITTPRAYVAGTHVLELQGNGDQEVGAGERASLAVSLHFTAATSGATASLGSNDPFVTVTAGSATLATRADRVSVANFVIDVAGNVPSNRVASLTLTLESPTGSVVGTFPIQVPVAPSFRLLELPWAYDRTLLPALSAPHLLVADEFREPPAFDRVYAAFRNSNGSFTPPVVLSDTTRNARRPQAVVASNGDVHVVFSQFVATLDFAGFPAYARYTAATGQWGPSTVFTSGAQVHRLGERNTSIAIDASGTPHIAFGSSDAVVTMRLVGGTWTPQVAFPIPAPTDDTYEVRLVNTSGPLQLFVRPVDTSALGNPTFDRPMFLLEFNGSAWSAPVQLAPVGANELAHLPFSFGGAAQRFYRPASSGLVSLAQLAGTAWSPVTPVLDINGVDFIEGFFSRRLGPSSFASFLSRPVAATQGSQRDLVVDGVTSLLRGDRKLRAERPFVLKDAAGPFHVFNQEQELFRVPNFGNFVDLPAFTSYYNTAPLASSALPSVPVVVDDGATTSNNRELHASWSSSHAAGIASYRVAWGTRPGADDLSPWQETTATSLTFDLDDQRLLPGQTAYASVRARSAALLSSDIGVSDGITFEAPAGNLCTAPPWVSTIVYHNVGTLVTHQGSTWENQYQQSHQVPGGGSFAWEFVAECVGEPVLAPCTAPAWSPSQQYSPGNRVSHNGFEFENLWSSSVPPDGSAGNPWKWVASCEP